MFVAGGAFGTRAFKGREFKVSERLTREKGEGIYDFLRLGVTESKGG